MEGVQAVRVRNLLIAAAAAAFFAASQAQAQQVHTLAEDAAAFGARDGVREMAVSPDGTKLVYVAPIKDRWSSVMVVDLTSGADKAILVSNGAPEVLRWCNFAGNDRLVCRFTGNARESSGVLLGFSRLVSLNLDGSDMKQLGQQASFYDRGLRQFDGQVLDWHAGTPGTVLMEREYVPEVGKTGTRLAADREGLGVDMVDVRTAKATPVEAALPDAAGFLSDGLGNVRVKVNAETKDEQATGRLRAFYRIKGGKEWRALNDYVDAEDFEPLAVDDTSDSLYALKKLNGRKALYRIKLDGTKAEELVASNPNVDIDDVVRVGDGLKVIGYTYTQDRETIVYFDKEFEQLHSQLQHLLPNNPQLSFEGASADGRKLLILAGGASDPGRYYLYDKQTHELNELLDRRPALENHPLGTVSAITYKAADGTSVPAYLTLPPGKTPKNLPAIVLPHGGPSARDTWGWHADSFLIQFLASRGYAVIQPEYRGSAGFGDKWLMDNGFKSWRTSIGDITAAARYLVSSGIADPNRLAIVGWSYGGYAALQSAATEPSLYKAVVAVAPVTDLEMIKREAQNYTSARLVEKEIGSGPHVVDGSPLRHVAAISAPVLLVHADMDLNVDIEHSDKMNEALKSAGKQVEYIRINGLDHYIDDSVQRTNMLLHIGNLLDRTIGH
jgi:dipeptidyl aminopeptidase/acylaminoacyl peptidase